MKKFNIFLIFVIICIARIVKGEQTFINILTELKKNKIIISQWHENYLKSKFNNPLNLNSVSKIDLYKLRILSNIEADSLIDYRQRNKPFASIYELQAINQITVQKLKFLKYFIYVEDTRYNLKLKNSYIFYRYIQKFDDFSPKNYLGYRDQHYIKIKINGNTHFKIGLLLKKDEGEQFIFDMDTNRFFFNKKSVSLGIYDISPIKSCIFGDYQFGAGQGLTTAEGYHLNKSYDPIFINRCQRGLQPYQSTDKSIIYRGMATTLKFKNWENTIFISRLFQDGKKNIEEPLTINSIEKSLKYNTQNNLSKKDTLEENIYGFNTQYEANISNFGLTFIYRKFDPPILKINSKSKEVFPLEGTDHSNISSYARLRFFNILFFSEGAISISNSIQESQPTNEKNLAFILGACIAINKILDFTVSSRYYGENFNSIRGNSFRKGQKGKNEFGFYLSTKCQITDKCLIHAYYDIIGFPQIIDKIKEDIICTKLKYNTTRTSFWEVKQKFNLKKVKPKDDNDSQYKNFSKTSLKFKFNVFSNFSSETETKLLKNFAINQLYIMLVQKLGFKYKKISFKSLFTIFNSGSSAEDTFYLQDLNLLYEKSFPARHSNVGQKLQLVLIYNPNCPLRFDVKYEVKRSLASKDSEYKFRHKLTFQLSYRLS